MVNNTKRSRFFLAAIITGLCIILILFFLSSNVIAQSQDPELQRQMNLILDTYNFIKDYYVDEEKTSPKIIMEGALKGMLEALDDPYSVYLTKEDMANMEETTIGKFGGVGLYILDVDSKVEVARPIEGTPAFKAGIIAGDIIIAVNDESVVDMNIDEVIKRLKGDAGTEVKITVLRDKNTLDFNITRDMIEIPTVKKAMMPDGNAYLKINQFTPLTFDQVKDAILFFKGKNYKGLIIDLRSNPGGVLSSVVDVADLFFPYGKLIVYTKSRIKSENQQYKARGKMIVPEDIPIVVLIDRYSASASEILTGVLKDHKRATIIGEKSYGKGSVQQIRYTGEGGIKLTTAKYFTPSGISINGIGIEPDIAVKEDELTEAEKKAINDLLDSNKIRSFVENHKPLTDDTIKKFIESLKRDGNILSDRYLKRLIRNEANRTNNNPPVYDLDYDLVLQKAVEVLDNTTGKSH